MFKFIVRHFGFLKHIPVVPHVYDALLKIQLFITNRNLLDCLDDVEAAASGWNDVTVSLHKYGGTQFNLGNYELGHLHGNGLLDVLLNRQLKAEFMQHPAVREHHVIKNSGWISLWIKTPADTNLAISILESAYALRKKASLTTP